LFLNISNGTYSWEYTACYPYSVITIESLTYVPHLGKILGVGGGTVVTFDPKNISSGCVATSINGAYRLQGKEFIKVSRRNFSACKQKDRMWITRERA
jgi:hypothetical protein